ncbi:MAG: peptidylprolyl isomerase [Gammaproteobacteria bacterium]|nr:peptidylprolyl isomerase [Gammaproteobacteria bacterium]
MNKLLARLLAVALLASASAFGTAAHAQALQPVDRIAAVVNEDVILRSELDRAVRNILAQYATRQEQLPPRDVLERQVLERLILVRLQVARAAETGVRVSDEEADAAGAAVAAQNNLTAEQLRQQLARDGLSYADFRSSLRDELVIQRLRQRFAQSRISVTDAEVDAALAVHTSGGTQYRLAHILVALPEGATPEQIALAQQKIDGVKALIDKGEMEFAAAAVRYSNSPNALEGGDLGWRGLDEIPGAFAGSIRSMQPGQVIGPVRGPSGFQLLKLVETRDSAAQAETRNVTQFRARHILVRTGDSVSDAQAKARIDTLRARIDGGADFAKVAAENSDDLNSRPQGGDLGWFVPDAYGPEFGAQLPSLQDGQVSSAFKTQAGWHLVQRVGTRQANVTDDSRRAQVRETIGQRKLEDEWNRLLREMRGEAYVDIRTGTAPAEATAAPPSTGN